MFRIVVIIIGLALGLGGCTAIRDRLSGTSRATAAALPFKAAFVRGDDPRLVQVAVTAPVGTSVDAMRESARYQATVYCLRTYGNSDTEWVINPATGDWAFARAADTATFRGRCAAT